MQVKRTLYATKADAPWKRDEPVVRIAQRKRWVVLATAAVIAVLLLDLFLGLVEILLD